MLLPYVPLPEPGHRPKQSHFRYSKIDSDRVKGRDFDLKLDLLKFYSFINFLKLNKMKRTATIFLYLLGFALLLPTLHSCDQETEEVGGTTDKIPGNVHISDFSSSNITVSWDLAEGATSYTAQLLESRSSDTPVDAYTTSYDHYQFSGLKEAVGYYVRVRANDGFATGSWVYVMSGGEVARIMAGYGIVDEDFVVPEPEPVKELYPNFPEGWEEHDERDRKKSHTGAGPTGRQSDVFPSGEWLMPNMYTNSAAAIVNKVGTWAVMMNANVATCLEMDFDLHYGASKFSFYYGTPTITNANDLDVVNTPIVVTVSYSQDGGESWTQIGEELYVTTADNQYFIEYELNIKGPVRFKICKSDSRARLMIDEISVYEN